MQRSMFNREADGLQQQEVETEATVCMGSPNIGQQRIEKTWPRSEVLISDWTTGPDGEFGLKMKAGKRPALYLTVCWLVMAA